MGRVAASQGVGHMDRVIVRPGRLEDEPYIKGFTKDTFDWGDYVGEAYADWVTGMAEGKGDVYVAVAVPAERPVGLTHVEYLSPDEAWFEGIRVDPAFRRMGIGRLLTVASIEGARRHGTRVCRAAIDADNEKSVGLAESFGFKPVASIVEFEADLAELSVPHRPNCPPIRPQPSICPHPLIPSLHLKEAGPEDVPAVYQAISEEMTYIGIDFRWWRVSLDNVQRVIRDHRLRLAFSDPGGLVAGVAASEVHVDQAAHSPIPYGELSSVFGDAAGIFALTEEYAAEMAEAVEKGLPGKLTVTCESDSPAVDVLPFCGFRNRSGQIRLWELKLED